MLVFRSLAIGLLGACVILLATRPPYEMRWVREPGAAVCPQRLATSSQVDVIDVASNVSAVELAGVLHLGPEDHVTAVDDRAVRDDIEAGTRIAAIALRPDRFIDLTVAGRDGSRRVLVLLH